MLIKKFYLLLLPFLSILIYRNCSANIISTSSSKIQNENITDGSEIYKKLGQKIDLNLSFTNQDNKIQTIKEMIDKQKTLIITLNYYRCTTMCTFQFVNLASALKKMDWPVGDGFAVSTISFDPTDSVKMAYEKQQLWRAKTGQVDADWNFYVGDHKNITSLTKQLNFYYEKIEDEYSHSAALIFIKPDGTFYRYLYGIVYESEDIKHALIETSEGFMGSFFQKMYTKLRKYQPAAGKYVSR